MSTFYSGLTKVRLEIVVPFELLEFLGEYAVFALLDVGYAGAQIVIAQSRDYALKVCKRPHMPFQECFFVRRRKILDEFCVASRLLPVDDRLNCRLRSL